MWQLAPSWHFCKKKKSRDHSLWYYYKICQYGNFSLGGQNIYKWLRNSRSDRECDLFPYEIIYFIIKYLVSPQLWRSAPTLSVTVILWKFINANTQNSQISWLTCKQVYSISMKCEWKRSQLMSRRSVMERDLRRSWRGSGPDAFWSGAITAVHLNKSIWRDQQISLRLELNYSGSSSRIQLCKSAGCCSHRSQLWGISL